ncbi:MAG: SGNH/GDSL hydrolase family protein [Clostridia bacterium]|nr:SGNH/GDSL hydrolase family protein [Clostridia bacterium]
MMKEAAKVFSKVVLSDKKVKIKLLGDSITHGVGGTGFAQSGEPIVAGFARNPDGFCWAKLFKDYMEKQYNCEVVNNACTGRDIQFISHYFDQLVDKDDDIVICTIGTNNRQQYFRTGERIPKTEYMKRFYSEIIKLHGKFREAGVEVIFVANIPASVNNEKDGADYWRVFHMNDVSDMYLKASFECGFPFISMYNAFLNYCEIKNIDLNTLLKDGLHPNDEGYKVMFKLLMDELGLARSVE